MSIHSQSDLVKELSQIFPEFASYWGKEVMEEEFPSTNLHSVYMSFVRFLGTAQPTEKQWKLLANHLNDAVSSGGELENAADTCVLEHLHQLRLNKVIRPLLNQRAKNYVRS